MRSLRGIGRRLDGIHRRASGSSSRSSRPAAARRRALPGGCADACRRRRRQRRLHTSRRRSIRTRHHHVGCTIRIKPGVYKERVRVPAGKDFVLIRRRAPRSDSSRTTSTPPDGSGWSRGRHRRQPQRRGAGRQLPAREHHVREYGRRSQPGRRVQRLRRPGRPTQVPVPRADRTPCWPTRGVSISGTVHRRARRFHLRAADSGLQESGDPLRAGGSITAAKTPEDQPARFVFSRCRITAATGDGKFYLGRPWGPFASVTFLKSYLCASRSSRRVGTTGINRSRRRRPASPSIRTPDRVPGRTPPSPGRATDRRAGRRDDCRKKGPPRPRWLGPEGCGRIGATDRLIPNRVDRSSL